MAIEKMKLLGITGKNYNLDKFLANVLFKSDLQIEDVKKIYDKTWKLTYFDYNYKIKETLKICENLLQKLNIPFSKQADIIEIQNNIDYITNKVEEINIKYDENIKIINDLVLTNNEISNKIEELSKIENLKYDVKKLYNMKYIKFRYGVISKKNLFEIKKEIDNLNVILFEIYEENENVWIMYFTTEQFVGGIDSIFNIQKFERKLLPDDIDGMPKEYILKLKEKIKQNEIKISNCKQELDNQKKVAITNLIFYYRELQTYDKINTLKKYIAHDQNDTFYLVVWISEENFKFLEEKLKLFQDIDYVIEDTGEAPTKLKNNIFIKPFELLVKMYGVPNKNEIDPTWFVALSTFLMFGFMFGDIGHGLIFFLIGLILMLRKKDYGAILFAGGVSSIIFGILYGSIFGKEEIIKPILISPMNSINTMLVYGIIVGTILILLAMIINIVNGIKNKDYKKIFIDENGIAGILLYILVLSCLGYYVLNGKMLISINIIVIVSVILVLIIMFNEQISNLIAKKKKSSTPFIEKVFEIIEMLLSFLSNTISFLRLAAFAINHAGLCMAVYLLADMSTGAGNILIAIIGNIIVLVLEGLIVGIQTLRLEYYELFSRFYEGSGQEYKSIKAQLEE